MMSDNTNQKLEIALFGGGCFWCTEAVFKMLKGVSSVIPGYSGGSTENPTYEEVCSGKTGHAEVTQVQYDPTLISYKDLLTVFFGTHDPTTKNRQGNDVGTEYRSVIFYTTPKQQEEAIAFIKEINDSDTLGVPIVTEIEPLKTFYPAENYHQDFYARNQYQPYCQIIINPKLEKVQEHFAHLLNDRSKIN